VLAKSALGYVDTSENYVFDQDQAKQLLDEAGWTPGSDGIREKDGEKLTLTFNEALPQPRSREVVTLIQEQLAEIGIGVEIFAGDQVAQDEAQRNIDTVQVYHSMVGRADFDVLKSQLYSANRNAALNLNAETGDLYDPELDELLAKIASVPTTEERQEASAAAQQHIAENAYVLPLFEEPQVFGLQSWVKGFQTESIGRPSFYEVTIEK
jgi:peptide/nickel transport system substrate-binding protein